MMNNEQHKQIRNALMMAALDCGHTIDSDGVTLQCDPAKPGNSLAQLSDRLLEAYLAAASAAVRPVQAPQAMVPLSADDKSVWIDGVGDVRLAQAQVPVAAMMYMDELPAAQAGEKWIQQFSSQANKALYAPDEASQAVRIKWCAYFDSYDRLVAAYLLTRDSKNWTQLTKVCGEAFASPVQPVAVRDSWKPLPIRMTPEMKSILKEAAPKWSAESIYDNLLEAAPAAPTAHGDAKDTDRLRWLAETGARISWSMDGEYCAVWLPDERDGTESRPAEGYPLKCYDSWHSAIDAAIAAKAAS